MGDSLDGRHPDTLPLTAAQEGIWLGHHLDPSSPLYNAAEVVEIVGLLDVALFERALRQAVAESDVVHVRVEAGAHGLVQVLDRQCEWPLPVVDVSGERDPRQAARAWMAADLATVVDPATGPLFAHALFRLGADDMLWYHRAHHIALDGYSFSLIASRVAALYTAFGAGAVASPGVGSPFGALRAAVDDDVAYQCSTRREADRDFWMARFADRPDPVTLGSDRPPGGGILRRGVRLADDVTHRWRRVADECGTTWAEVVLAAVANLLHRRTGAADVVLGVPVMGRLGSVAARIPVMMMNVVPLRVSVSAGASIGDLARVVAAEMRAIRPHLRYRGEHLRRDLGLVGGGRRLFGPMVNVMPFDYALDFGGSPATATNLSAGAAFVEDLAVQLHVRSDGAPPALDIDVNAHSYDAGAAATCLEQIEDALIAVGDRTEAGGSA